MIPATPADVAAITEAMTLAALLDDRIGQPDKARLRAWAAQIHRHSFEESDLLDGVQSYYDGPADSALGIGDLIHHAKIARQIRVGRETAAERDARRAELDGKADPQASTAITAAFMSGPVPERQETPRLRAAREALDACYGREACREAIAEFFAAKRSAVGR